MSHSGTPDDLIEGWPEDPDRSDVEAFARNLQGNLPELPPEAMQRIGGQMHDEMALQRWRRRRLRMIAAVSTLAASVVIGIGIWQMTRDEAFEKTTASDPPMSRGGAAVRDQYRVPILPAPVMPTYSPLANGAGNTLPQDRPLIALPGERPQVSPGEPSLLSFDLRELTGLVGQPVKTVVPNKGFQPIPHDTIDDTALHDWSGWRMLAGNRPLESLVEKGNFDPANSDWHLVYELTAALRAKDRDRLVVLATQSDRRLPKRFPIGVAESAYFELLHEGGYSPTQAGLAVIRARSFEPLHALHDLDRQLTREAEFLNLTNRKDDADAIRLCRDGLREAYLKSARNVVEKLFALALLGRDQERKELLARVRKLEYLVKVDEHKQLLNRLGNDLAWEKLIQPLLENEVAFVDNPPDFTRIAIPNQGDLIIGANGKEPVGNATRYSGNVKVELGRLHCTCEALLFERDDKTGHATLVGSGHVRIAGIVGIKSTIVAERFSFSTDTFAFTLGGAIRVPQGERVLKLTACSINRHGEIRDVRSLIDDFQRNVDTDRRLELLPAIAKVYTDDELPNEIRYWLALHLLRPHLTWHAPYLPPKPDRRELEEIRKVKQEVELYANEWGEALGAEYWMLSDITDDTFNRFLKTLEERAGDGNQKNAMEWAKQAKRSAFFWRIKDSGHANVQRAANLLGLIPTDSKADQKLVRKASRWLTEIRRNNTILTLDITGSFAPGKDAPLLIDARNADDLKLSLYRATGTADLLYAADRIGRDFIFRDHGLQYEEPRQREALEMMKDATKSARALFKREHHPLPPGLQAKPIAEWKSNIADLPVHRERRERQLDYDIFDDPEAEYFDDACYEHRERIDKSYRPQEGLLSSWQCDRVLKVPGQFLKESGGYILVVEANGQQAYVPLLVDPLSLSLKRCRDGVFVAVHDADGFTPLANAKISARAIVRDVKTDKEGVAFAKVAAAGDRAIVVEKDGRFAVGGFGRVFDGIYTSPFEEERERFRFAVEQRIRKLRDERASVYDDRYVVAAYTDRPTYRPGQQVQFKLIVRRMLADGEAKVGDSFRAGDFETQSRLEVPRIDKPLDYSWVDPKGRIVATGSLSLSEFGTGAASLTLNAEAATGDYVLKLKLADRVRLVPDVFAVQNYRLPTFELKVNGLPDKPGDHRTLKLDLHGEYYFGKAVEGGQVTLELIGPGARKSIEEKETKLDADGRAKVEFKIPAHLSSGAYRLIARLRDAGGRSVQRIFAIELKRGDAVEEKATFANLPRFAPLDSEIVLRSTAMEIIAEQRFAPPPGNDVAIRQHRFPVKNGEARIRVLHPGWYRLTAGDESAEIFIYGGKEPPDFTSSRAQRKRDRERRRDDERQPYEDPHAMRWVDLSDNSEDDTPAVASWARHDERLLALLGGYKAQVGEKHRLLVYVPKEKARLVFTYEGFTVRDYHFVTVDGSKSHYHLIELPIRPRCLPHFYLAGHALRGSGADADLHAGKEWRDQLERIAQDGDDGRDADPRWRRIDVSDPRPRPNGERLTIDVRTDRETYRPGDKVNVALRVKDETGRPASAELSLGAIDESLYSFGDDNIAGLAAMFIDPHPAEGFRAKTWRSAVGRRWKLLAEAAKANQAMDQVQKRVQEMAKMQCDVQIVRELTRLLSDSPGRRSVATLDGALPASSMPLARLRSDFRETAVWLPQLVTDANGEAKAEFTLPDSLTRYRLTAVAIDRQSNVGTARTSITSRLPLGAQIILPRFAVERDHFFAFGLIHNQTGRDQDVNVEWQIDGIAVARLDDGFAQDGTRVRGKLRVAAGKSERIALELKAERAGEARIELKMMCDTEADAEKRTLPIHTLGRAREVVLEGSLQGKRTLELPAGFEPRNVRLILARGEAVQALDGVGYLIDYPYGCVEQTMSRFLPAVVIREAAKRTPIHLAPEVAAKLPLVIARGLARLHRFQHADGGWGWWEHDQSNDNMTAYVVYGLALCQNSHLELDKAMLEQGCAYLRKQLRDGKLGALVEAKAWQALATAGRADANELSRAALRRLERNSTGDERAILALACKSAGLHEIANRLERTLSDWKPEHAESMALQLNVRVTFGAPLADCRSSAEALLKRRTNHRWSSTQATAASILALADYTSFMTVTDPARGIRVLANGAEIVAIRDPEALKKLVQHVDLPLSAFAGGNRKIELSSEGETPLAFTLVANGAERLDKVEPRGKEVKISRKYEPLDGKPLDRPLKVGEACAVRLTVELEREQEYLIVEDRRPSNCEYADDQATHKIRGTWAGTEFRDDRVCLFFTHLLAGRHEVIYYLRAETPGSSNVLPGCAYPMYAESLRGETGSLRVDVAEKQR